MFCFQCQEAAKNTGCTIKGVCGMTEPVSDLQDLLVYVVKGAGYLANLLRENGKETTEADRYVMESLFVTITNANFDDGAIRKKIIQGNEVRSRLREELNTAGYDISSLPDCTTWESDNPEEMLEKAKLIGVLQFEKNEDIRSLKELLLYGMKGMAAYGDHASVLGYENPEIFGFMHRGLSAMLQENAEVNELFDMVMECGKYGVEVMALLDKAHTETYGNPEITRVNIDRKSVV